jgi:hypothetical protein
LLYNGTKAVTTSNASDPDLIGTFAFSGLPAGSLVVQIEMDGFATTQRSITVPQSQSLDPTPVTTSLGDVTLGKPYDLTVTAVDGGTPIAGVAIVAISQNYGNPYKISGVTQNDGTVVLKGLDLSNNYFITTEQVYDTNGNIMYSQVSCPFTAQNSLANSLTIPLQKASTVDLSVVVTDKGTPIAGVTVSALAYGGQQGTIYGVTGLDGIAVLKGLSLSNINYQIVTNAVLASDGTSYKYSSSMAANYFNPANTSNRTVSIALQTPSDNSSVSIIATNLLTPPASYSYPQFNPSAIKFTTPGGAIKIVFSYPVSLTGAVTASYQNTLVASGSPNDGATITINTVSAALDATGTIMTITNSAPYLIDQTYTFNGGITGMVNGTVQPLDLNNLLGQVSIADNTVTGLNASSFVADNYSGTWDGGTGINTPNIYSQNLVYINFPEYVYGTYRIVSTSVGATTNYPYYSNDANFTPVAVFAARSGGKDAKIVYRQPLYLYMPDSVGSNLSQVTVYLDVTDAFGNSFSGQVTLNVQ